MLRKFRRREPLYLKVTLARVTIVVLSGALAASCAAQALAPQAREFYTQDQISQHYNQVQPAPVGHGRSQIRQNLTELELSQMNGTQTTTFFCPGYGCSKTSPPFKSCYSIGAPIPTTDSLTNPQQPLRENSQPLNNQGGNQVVDQMEPTGIYPGNSSGTYVQCVRSDGSVKPSYWEGDVYVEWGNARWDQKSGSIVDTGASSFHFTR